jgi:hypothetical protein
MSGHPCQFSYCRAIIGHSKSDEDDIIEALEHNDRIYKVKTTKSQGQDSEVILYSSWQDKKMRHPTL